MPTARPASRLVWTLAMFVGAAAAAFAGAFVGNALGLILSETYMALAGLPVAMAGAGLLAALAAKWVGDFAAPDRSRARLRPLAGGCALTGLVVGGVMSATLFLGRGMVGRTLFAFLLPAFLAVAAVAVAIALRARDARRPLKRDALATLGLALAVPALYALLVFVGCALDECGA